MAGTTPYITNHDSHKTIAEAAVPAFPFGATLSSVGILITQEKENKTFAQKLKGWDQNNSYD